MGGDGVWRGAVHSDSTIKSSMRRILTRTSMQIKLLPEKECDLPRLPAWLQDNESDSEDSIGRPQGGDLGQGQEGARARARAKKGTGVRRGKPGQRCLGRDVEQSQGTFVKPLMVLSV